MSKAKFRVGDKVKILDGSTINRYTGSWNYHMKEEIGNIYPIREVCPYEDERIAYRLSGNGYVWDERGLKLVKSKKPETIVIYRNGQETIALNKVTGDKATSKCSPKDEYDFETGANLAFDRLMSASKKPKFKVGDRVIGNKKADEYYVITKKGWKGIVTEAVLI